MPFTDTRAFCAGGLISATACAAGAGGTGDTLGGAGEGGDDEDECL